MSKINEIILGWGNLIKDKFGTLDEQTKIMAQIRLEQCHSCSMRIGNICSPTKKTKHIITNESVRGCGCSLPTKSLSPDSECPAGKW